MTKNALAEDGKPWGTVEGLETVHCPVNWQEEIEIHVMCFPLRKMIDKDTLVFLLICLLICYQKGHV